MQSTYSRKFQVLASHCVQSLAGLSGRAKADPEGTAAGGWQLPEFLAAEQHVVFPSKHKLKTSMGATAFKHFCSKITRSKNNLVTLFHNYI